MPDFEKAKNLLREFKGDSYLFGTPVLSKVGNAASKAGKRAVLIADLFDGSGEFIQEIRDSVSESQVDLVSEIEGAKPNCPLDDLARITDEVKSADPDVIISFGGGSTIDSAKAAEVLHTLGRSIDGYFGNGLVTAELQDKNLSLTPHVAIQAAASSAAHLTKYANITDLSTGQKKLIVDEAIIPEFPVFDYRTTYDCPKCLTSDGGLDGIAHCLEVLYGAVGKDCYQKVQEVADTGIALAVEYLPRVISNLSDKEARHAICLATDLGGYAIMLGGTNGGHLTSFSLVDVLTHGRACAIMNPYYTVLFAPAIEGPLKLVGNIFKDAGYTNTDIQALTGRDLGIAVAEAMFSLADKIGFPTTLQQVEGFSREHIDRALTAAKNPQLKMKLQNMPVPLTVEMVDEYMGPVLEAASSGDLSLITNV